MLFGDRVIICMEIMLKLCKYTEIMAVGNELLVRVHILVAMVKKRKQTNMSITELQISSFFDFQEN